MNSLTGRLLNAFLAGLCEPIIVVPFFLCDFNENSKRHGQTMTIKLLTGEKITITYLRITGIFLSLDETFNPETITSIGPSAAECGGGNFIVPISMVDYCPVNQNFLLMDIDGTNQFRH